jgi:hypothetical protein
MFVRWQMRTRRSRAFGRDPRTNTHWAAILAESQRIDGKPTQRHVAYLGGITDPAIELPAQRALRSLAPFLITASASLAQFLLNRFQPFSEGAIYGADFSRRDSSRGDVGQYSALKHCDLV